MKTALWKGICARLWMPSDANKEFDDVTFNNINKNIKLKSNNLSNITMNKWDDKDMNILIPMAGAGKRLDAGYIFPKPIIEIQNKPMIQWVIDIPNINANYIFIIQKEHQQKFIPKRCYYIKAKL